MYSLQATGLRLSCLVESFVSVAVGFAIGFVCSWKLSLISCVFAPFIVTSGIMHMKLQQSDQAGNRRSIEDAGKVSVLIKMKLEH